MNSIYRNFWNASLGAGEVTSELANASRKGCFGTTGSSCIAMQGAGVEHQMTNVAVGTAATDAVTKV